MKAVSPIVVAGLLGAWWGVVSPPVRGQTGPLLPLDDAEALTPLLPAGLSRNIPELYGDFAHVWALDAHTQVIQYHGDFSLHLGDRRLQSQEAVVWMQKSRWQEQTYYHYEAYLAHKAQVRDTAGTLSGSFTTSKADLERELTGEEGTVYQHHSWCAAARHVLLRRGQRECYVVAAPMRKKTRSPANAGR